MTKIDPSELTPQERQELGISEDSMELVDIDLPEPVQMVEADSDKRQEARRKLESVTRPGSSPIQDKPKVDLRVEELEKQLKEVPQACPRCLHPISESVEIEPTEEDLQDFVRSVLSGNVFKKTYDIFGGVAKVTFRTRHGWEDELIRKLTKTEVSTNRINGEQDLYFTLNKWVMLISLDTYSTREDSTKFQVVPESCTEEDLNSMLVERRNCLTTVTSQVISSLFKDFSQLVVILTDRARDPNYWAEIVSSI